MSSSDSSDLLSKWNEQDEKRRKQKEDEEFRNSLVNVITLDQLLLEFRAQRDHEAQSKNQEGNDQTIIDSTPDSTPNPKKRKTIEAKGKSEAGSKEAKGKSAKDAMDVKEKSRGAKETGSKRKSLIKMKKGKGGSLGPS